MLITIIILFYLIEKIRLKHLVVIILLKAYQLKLLEYTTFFVYFIKNIKVDYILKKKHINYYFSI